MDIEEVTIEDVLYLKNGFAFKSNDYKNAGVPLVRIQNIVNNQIEIGETTVYLPSNYSDKYDDFVLKKNDILIALSGASVGKFGINRIDSSLLLNQRVGLIREKRKDKLLSKFFYYYLYYLIPEIKSKAKGGAQPNISMKTIGRQKIFVPPIEKQIEAIGRFEIVEELVQKRKESLELLDEYLNSFFLEIFGDPIINDKGWKKKRLEDIVSSKITYGVIKSGENTVDGVPFVRAIDLGRKYIIKENLKRISKSISNQFERTILKGNEILLGIRGKTGAVSLSTLELKDANVARGIVPLRFSSDAIRKFYYQLFLQKNMQIYFKRMQKGMAIKGLNLIDLKKMELIQVDDQLIFHFYEKLKFAESQKSQLQKSIQLLEELFQSLIYGTFYPQKEQEKDEIQVLLNDEVLMKDFFDTIQQSDFQSFEQYDIEVQKLHKVLSKTKEGKVKDKTFYKGIIQILNDKKVQLQLNKKYLNESPDEATKA